jgi:carboxyl-terminal processing protease
MKSTQIPTEDLTVLNHRPSFDASHIYKGVLALVITLFTAAEIFSSLASAGGQPWEMPKEVDQLRFRLTNTVFAHIKDYYIDFHNLVAIEVLRDALRGIEDAVPNLGIDVRPEEVLVTLDNSTRTFDTIGIKSWLVLRELLKEIITFIESGGNGPAGTPELECAALNGVLNNFDPFSRLYRPEDMERIRTLGSGSFVGLGMDVEYKEGFLTVVYLYKDSPAHRAGLQVGDRIAEIEGESTRNMGLSEALSRMSGPQDTSRTLSVWRGSQLQSFTLRQERIELEHAEWRLLEEGMGYVRLKGFQEGAFYSMVKAIRGLEELGELKGLVLDLRDNYGGVMEEIIKVAELFLPSGIITIKTVTGQRLPEFVTARPSGRIEETCPIVVLVDEGSASGAEILAATLRANGRALLVGEPTFGKACIQQVFRLHGRYALKLTTAKYFTPEGEYINLKGLTPDLLLVPIRLERDKTTLAHRVQYAQEGPPGDGQEKSARHPAPGKLATLCYLEKEREVHPPGESQKDFQVQLARGLLKAALSGGWQASLEVVKKYQEGEDKKIIKTLESRRIDWSVGPPEGIPTSVASLSIDKEEIEAGNSVTFTLSVENRGEGPLYRVLARSVSGNPAFSGLEFPIGKIEPGRRGSYSLRVDVPEDSLDRRDEIVVRFTEDNGFPPADIVTWVTVWAHPTPQFAYTCRLPQVQTGRETELSLRVKNVGYGVSHRNVVVLKGDEESAMVILKGRQELGILKPGEEREVKLAFTLADATARLKPLKLLITDLLLGTGLSASLPLQAEGTTGELFGLPPSIILQNAVLQAMAGLVELSFIAKDDQRLKGAYVMVNEHKAFFGHNPQPTPEHTFTASLPILKGPNLIRVVAYDDQGLSTEKVFVVTGR